MQRTLILICAGFLSASAAHTDVLNVGGPNPDAMQIEAAIQMASDGDVLRVFPGQYSGFTIHGKTLSIVPSAAGVRPEILGAVHIEKLYPLQSVELFGFSMRALRDTASLDLFDCRGAVRLHDLIVRPVTTVLTGRALPICKIRDCDDVVLANSSIAGHPGEEEIDTDGGRGGVAVHIEDSQVALYRSAATGGKGGDGYFLSIQTRLGGPGGNALEVHGTGRLYMAQCILEGGIGGADDFVLSNGHGWPGDGLQGAGPGFPVDQRQCLISSSVGGGITTLSGTQPRLAAPHTATDTGILTVIVKGTPGDRVGLFFGAAHDHRAIPGEGPLLVAIPVGPNPRLWMYLGTIDGTGTLTHDLNLRNLPPWAHAKLHLVAVAVSSTTRRYTNSVSPILLDSAW